MNLYEYVHSNPIMSIDPSGLLDEDSILTLLAELRHEISIQQSKIQAYQRILQNLRESARQATPGTLLYRQLMMSIRQLETNIFECEMAIVSIRGQIDYLMRQLWELRHALNPKNFIQIIRGVVAGAQVGARYIGGGVAAELGYIGAALTTPVSATPPGVVIVTGTAVAVGGYAAGQYLGEVTGITDGTARGLGYIIAPVVGAIDNWDY